MSSIISNGYNNEQENILRKVQFHEQNKTLNIKFNQPSSSDGTLCCATLLLFKSFSFGLDALGKAIDPF